MEPESDDLIRLAMFEAWGEKCVWCGRPLFFNEMEVEHLVPKSLEGQNIGQLIAGHGLKPDFDVRSLENLAPSCGPCNRGKGRKPPPEAPFISKLLDDARGKAPGISEIAEKLHGKRKLDKALVLVREAAASDDGDALRALQAAAGTVSTELIGATGKQVERLHPALSLLHGEWRVVKELPNDVAVVTADGVHTGYTGTDISWMCPHCGSYGPWFGNRCSICGRWDSAD